MCPPADLHASDHYKVLGIPRGATDAEVTKAYRRLALKWHPDKNPGDAQAEENFKRITEAYEVLHSEEKRQEYDCLRKGSASRYGGGTGSRGVPCDYADEIFKAFFASPSVTANRDTYRDVFFPDFTSSFGTGMPSRSGIPFYVAPDSYTAGFASRGMGAMPSGRSSQMPETRRGGAAPVKLPHVLPVGTSVVVRGLSNKPEYNGRTGSITGWDQERCRYEVEVGTSTLSLRPLNLTQLTSVEIVGLESKPELNGRTGEVFNCEDGRYMVSLDCSSIRVGLLPENCIFLPGTRAVTQGLSNAEFNSQMVQIVAVDRATSRYLVQCQDGKQIKIRFGNVLC
mmetsp:Transcript_3487/g.5640  ORF Transcript_3487/g.5640 Transcript_3487/m.5640 type:complete len:340 (-) Transcript_3487:93-1112(-)